MATQHIDDNQQVYHIPALLQECMTGLDIKPGVLPLGI